MVDHDDLGDFTVEKFTFDGKERSVYVAGDGPAVIVIAEIPGITPAVAGFARRVVERGFTVFMPHLFGEPGAPATPVTALRSIGPACVSKEFIAFARRTTSPVV